MPYEENLEACKYVNNNQCEERLECLIMHHYSYECVSPTFSLLQICLYQGNQSLFKNLTILMLFVSLPSLISVEISILIMFIFY